MSNPEPVPGKCNAKTRNGGFCAVNPPPGSERCTRGGHAGVPKAQVRAKAEIVREVMKWGLGDTTLDPGDLMLRLMSQSANRVVLYSRLLEEAYEAAGRLELATERGGDLLTGEVDERQMMTARLDLRRIFSTGGVAVLIGNTYNATRDGDIFATGEAIRGLAKLEADERDRCMNFAAKAVGGRLAERQVALAEKQAGLMYDTLAAAMDAIDATPQQRAIAMAAMASRLGAAPVINGELAQ